MRMPDDKFDSMFTWFFIAAMIGAILFWGVILWLLVEVVQWLVTK